MLFSVRRERSPETGVSGELEPAWKVIGRRVIHDVPLFTQWAAVTQVCWLINLKHVHARLPSALPMAPWLLYGYVFAWELILLRSSSGGES